MLTLNIRGKLTHFSRPLVMGILNATPDSFYDGAKHNLPLDALSYAEKMIAEGVDIIDVGGYSSRPGATDISEEEELNRVIPVIENIINIHPQAIISIDTFRSNVAEKAVEAGASIINDISGGELDKEMFNTVAKLKVPYILMHMQGTPQTMQKSPHYNDVTKEIFYYFTEKIKTLNTLGITNIIIDPGFGFGKNNEHNYQLLKDLSQFKQLNLPILTGLSRKSMVTKILQVKAVDALNGTSVLNTLALQNGANILRVHDIKEAREVIELFCFYNSSAR